MGVTREEVLNILLLANHMVNTDGERHPNEKKMLVGLFKLIGTTAEEKKRISKKTSLRDMLNEFKSQEAANLLVDILVLIASVDGTFDLEERSFVERVMNKLEIDVHSHHYFETNRIVPEKLAQSRITEIKEQLKRLGEESRGLAPGSGGDINDIMSLDISEADDFDASTGPLSDDFDASAGS